MPESPGPVAINHDRLLGTFVDMLSVDSFHGDEDRVEAIIRPALEPLGIRFSHDAIGNLIGCWPGRGRSDGRIMLNAHMDTVQPTPNMRPVVDADGVRSDGSSVLGADDKAGLAAIIEAIRSVDDAGLDHAPIELVFTVGEDVGHIGSKAFDAASIESRTSFVFDAGGPVGNVVMRAPGQIRCTATLHGRAAHAGIEPELGISAISLLARAVDRMPLGRVDAETTANIGRIEGGQASNIVAPTARIEAEARSLSEDRLADQIAAMRVAVCGRGSGYGRLVRLRGTPLLRRLPTRGGRGCRSARRPRHQRRPASRRGTSARAAAATPMSSISRASPRCAWVWATSTCTPPRSSCRTMPYGTSRKLRRSSSRRPEPAARPTTTGASSPRASGRRLGCSG